VVKVPTVTKHGYVEKFTALGYCFEEGNIGIGAYIKDNLGKFILQVIYVFKLSSDFKHAKLLAKHDFPNIHPSSTDLI